MKISWTIVLVVAANVVIACLFLGSNIELWQRLNRGLTSNKWGPFEATSVPMRVGSHGEVMPAGLFFSEPNLPFMLFWVSTIVNMCFIIMILRSKKEHSNTKATETYA